MAKYKASTYIYVLSKYIIIQNVPTNCSFLQNDVNNSNKQQNITINTNVTHTWSPGISGSAFHPQKIFTIYQERRDDNLRK
jgi:hypothetical protein